jgi:hypothetical protein
LSFLNADPGDEGSKYFVIKPERASAIGVSSALIVISSDDSLKVLRADDALVGQANQMDRWTGCERSVFRARRMVEAVFRRSGAKGHGCHPAITSV